MKFYLNWKLIYSNKIMQENYDISSKLFDKKADSVKVKSFSAKRKTEVFSKKPFESTALQNKVKPDLTILKSGDLKVLKNAQFEIFYKDISSLMPIHDRVNKENLQKLLV